MKTITGKTIGINDILLNTIETISQNTKLSQTEIIRKAVEIYLNKINKLFACLDENDKRYRSDKKQDSGNLNIITCGLFNSQIESIENLIPGFASSRSEFVRISILDFLANNFEVKSERKTNVIIPIQQKVDETKVRIPIGPGLFKEYNLVKKGVMNENPISQ